MKSICTLTATASAIALTGTTLADINPWDFNVFSRSTIGTSASPYGSDYQGAAGAVGNAYFTGFGLRTVAGSSASLAESWYGGGTLSLSGQVYNGGVESAGTVTITSGTVLGNLRSGGDLAGTSGSITGAATLTGTKTAGNSLTVAGGVTPNIAFTPTVNLGSVSSYFLGASNAAAGLANTNTGAPGATTYANNFGGIVVNLSSTPGINVVSLTAAELNNAWGFTVNGAGTLIVNVLGGGTVDLDSTTWNYTGGASSHYTLLNYNQATAFNLSGGNIVNILAPNAAMHFSSGHVDGNLIVGGLTGSGQVNWVGGGFGGTIPAPSAAGALALGGLAAMRRKRR